MQNPPLQLPRQQSLSLAQLAPSPAKLLGARHVLQSAARMQPAGHVVEHFWLHAVMPAVHCPATHGPWPLQQSASVLQVPSPPQVHMQVADPDPPKHDPEQQSLLVWQIAPADMHAGPLMHTPW